MMNNKPLVSVIVPIYKAEKYFEQCLNSILCQSYDNLEVILVDDGSPDDCPKMCDEYAKKDARIVVVHKENGGVSTARNTALEICKGAYVLFVDSDDYIAPSMIGRLYDSLVKNSCDIASCGYTADANDVELNEHDHRETVLSRENALEDMLYQKNIAAGPVCKLCDKRLFNNVAYPVGVAFGEDLDVTYKLISRADKIVVNSAKLYYYRQHPASATYSRFAPKRMSSLKIIEGIVNDVREKYPTVLPAAINKLFTESIFVLIQIPEHAIIFNKERKQCLEIIRKYRKAVMCDISSKKVYRLYAALTYIGYHHIARVDRIKKRLRALQNNIKDAS